jgi:transcriptional regulator with XRE-family HTH domain
MAPIDGFYKRLGGRVRHWRRERGMTQADVGARLTPPVTRASEANLELGQQRVLAHTLVQLAAVLSITVDELIGVETAAPAEWAAVRDDLAAALQISAARAERLARRLGAPS